MGIFLNYGGAGSHHGGAGRITPCSSEFFGWAETTEVGPKEK